MQKTKLWRGAKKLSAISLLPWPLHNFIFSHKRYIFYRPPTILCVCHERGQFDSFRKFTIRSQNFSRGRLKHWKLDWSVIKIYLSSSLMWYLTKSFKNFIIAYIDEWRIAILVEKKRTYARRIYGAPSMQQLLLDVNIPLVPIYYL